MFVNNANGQRGLVCQYDMVCFDEVSGISFDQKDGVNIMKGYMESGEFSRGKPRRRGGRAAKRGLSKEQVPVLIDRERSTATANIILATDGKADLVAALKPLLPRTPYCVPTAAAYWRQRPRRSA